jgi:hypothetical protein
LYSKHGNMHGATLKILDYLSAVTEVQEHNIRCQTIIKNMLWGSKFKAFKTSGNWGGIQSEYPPVGKVFYVPLNNVLEKAVSIQDAFNQFSLPSIILYVGRFFSSRTLCYVIPSQFSHDRYK